jgi:hypothetical protein
MGSYLLMNRPKSMPAEKTKNMNATNVRIPDVNVRSALLRRLSTMPAMSSPLIAPDPIQQGRDHAIQ